jgi:hypothetical protein
MPQTCTICRHERRLDIDRALLGAGKAAGEEMHAGTIMERFRAISRKSLIILQEAPASANPVIALAAISRAERQIQPEARPLVGMNDERSNVYADMVNLTPKQIEAALALVREAEAKIEALRKSKQPADLIEAAAGLP